MRKILFIISISLVAIHLSADKVYFINSPKWTTVKAYLWTKGGEMSWPGMTMTKETTITCTKGDVYSIEAGSYVNIIFNCGNNCSQTGDLTLDASKPYWYEEQCYASIEDIENPQPTPTPSSYAVPSQCQDIMLQGFYWDSYGNKGYGDTKWNTLLGQAQEIGQYFSLIWLPPSAQSAGGLGYHPVQYNNQNSNLGTVTDLHNLISSLHANHVYVIADIVINHAGNKSTWCDFAIQSFGLNNKFYPDGSWITKNDEVSTKGSQECKNKLTNSHTDDGYGSEANYPSARDWDHLNPNVQNMCKAYLKWMKETMHYDGYRYDYAKGFKTSHINEYNMASEPYFSVLEYWDGNASTLKARINEASKNTLTFDFAERYTAFRDGIHLGGNYYSKLKNCGLRGMGYSKYAVTFVDNHDTFNRGSDNEDVGGTRDGSSINNASLILQCNAYIICMPGIPCVFYPHWVKYKSEIQSMIKARWIAGVHSESTVTEESGSGYYTATIQGKTGSIKLFLGPNSNYMNNPGDGYIQAYAGNNCGIYYKGTGAWPREDIHVTTDIEEILQSTTTLPNNKLLMNGKLYLHNNGALYDIWGNKVNK